MQRIDLAALRKDNPSLAPRVGEAITQVYGDALELAAGETGLPVAAFPASSPYSAEQVRSREFLPG
jgi:hypothetical protein